VRLSGRVGPALPLLGFELLRPGSQLVPAREEEADAAPGHNGTRPDGTLFHNRPRFSRCPRILRQTTADTTPPLPIRSTGPASQTLAIESLASRGKEAWF
jgi:hypothetical protein